MYRKSQKGAILITLIVAMVMIGVLGIAIYNLTTSSTFAGLLSNNNDQAYQLAQAGIRYKIKNLCVTSASGEFWMPDNNHKFIITYTDNGTTKIVTSIGIVNQGAFSEARRVIVYNVTDYWKTCDTDPNGNITIGPGTKPIGGGDNPANAIAVASDGTISLGGNTANSYGSLWYQGSSSAGNCNSGACDFNYGLRAYFDFTSGEDNSDDSTTRADGFTFTVLSAINNTRDRTGGAPPGISIGELMGYAGPGNTTDMLGLKPPKMAVEFDTYPNSNSDICGSGSRNDNNGNGGSSFRNHIAILFWGENVPAGSSCSGSYPRNSYDDNRHGSGSGDASPAPVNSDYTSDGYYEGPKDITSTRCLTLTSPTSVCNWMEDGHSYSFRMEIIRNNTSGNSGLYQLKAWTYRLDLGTPSGAQLTQFQNLQSPYATAPHIIRTITLSQADHDALRKVFFGFTEGTGGSNQNIQVNNLKVFFPQTSTCLYTISPTNLTASAAGVTGQTVTVTAGKDCSWTAVSNVGWITITAGAAGTNSGTVTYNVAANTGIDRSGTMTIAGQTFTVTQANGCTYTFGSCPAAFPRAGGTGMIAVTTDPGCTWTASDTVNWISVSPTSSSNTGSVTVTVNSGSNNNTPRSGTVTVTGTMGTGTHVDCTITENH